MEEKFVVIKTLDDAKPNRLCLGIFKDIDEAVEAVAKDYDSEASFDEEEFCKLKEDIKDTFLSNEDFDDDNCNTWSLMPLDGSYF